MSISQRWLIRGFFFVWFAICCLSFIIHGPLHFLLLNTFLAYVPIEISFQMNYRIIKNSWLFWIFFFIWLMFYPNAAYILTDLFHLALLNPYSPTTGLLRNSTWMWINFFMLVVSALVSAWVGFQTMFNVVNAILYKWKTNSKTLWISLVIILTILNAIGIYIGRFLRIHTVYLLISPRVFIEPFMHMWNHTMIAFVVIMTVMQFICYGLIWLTQQKPLNNKTANKKEHQ